MRNALKIPERSRGRSGIFSSRLVYLSFFSTSGLSVLRAFFLVCVGVSAAGAARWVLRLTCAVFGKVGVGGGGGVI